MGNRRRPFRFKIAGSATPLFKPLDNYQANNGPEGPMLRGRDVAFRGNGAGRTSKAHG